MSLPKKGFTLVELLVVIAIIAILSTIGVVVYQGVQKKARITHRIQSLTAVQKSLELYFSNIGSYPIADWLSECNGIAANNVIPGLVPQYLNALPKDPLMGQAGQGGIPIDTYCYYYVSDGKGYKFVIYNLAPWDMTGDQIMSQPNLVDWSNVSDDVGGCDANLGASQTGTSWAVYNNSTSATDYRCE